jgi:hypothetical protein
MAVKIFLSVSLVFWLLILYSDCGLQGVEASPVGKTSENRLDEIRNLYPKKTSVISKALSGTHEADQLRAESYELPFAGQVVTQGFAINITLIVPLAGGCVIADLYGNVTWYGGQGDVLVIQQGNIVGIVIVANEQVIAIEYIIIFVITCEVSKIYLLFNKYSKYGAT